VIDVFVERLRRAGLRISTAERIDAEAALAAVGLAERAAVHAALAATLCKRAADRPIFDEQFRLTFDRAAPGAAAGGAPDLPLRLLEAAEQVGTGRIESPLQIGMLAFRILDALGPDAGEPAALRVAVRELVEDALRARQPRLAERLAEATLADRAIAQLSASERAALDGEVQRLARRLATRTSEPRPRRRRGRLDVRATLRRAHATGGVPFDVRRRHRPRRRPRLVLLCDISDSVRLVSRFFLALVHALTRRYDRIHTFVFVADLGDATRLLRSRSVDRAIREILDGAVIDPFQSSDYGRALAVLADRHLGKIGSRTTVIVLGDARGNYRPHRADLLARIARRAHRVLWLDPEPPSAWGWGDSAIEAYRPHCDRVMTVWNLATLRDAVDELVRS
jgi:hypothetical protein